MNSRSRHRRCGYYYSRNRAVEAKTFIGWKKVYHQGEPILAKLEIPKTAYVWFFSIDEYNGKSRCSRAKVLGFYSLSGKRLPKVKSARSLWQYDFIYRLGKVVKPNWFDLTSCQCSNGIHFYVSQRRAAKHNQ